MSFIACLEALFSRIGRLTASFEREGGRLMCSIFRVHLDCGFERAEARLVATAERVPGLRGSFGLVCLTELGDDYCLWASDQEVITIDGGRVYTTIE